MGKRVPINVSVADDKALRITRSADGSSYDTLSLWTKASDVKVNDSSNLEDYYEDIKERSMADAYQYDILVGFLRQMGMGVSEYSTIDKVSQRAGELNDPIVEALSEITGEQVTNTTPQGIINHMRSIDSELQRVLGEIEITASGTQEIVSALDSL